MTVFTPQLRLIPAVSALGIDVREALQKGEIDAAVYLLDQADARFGYSWEWERYGPFSEALAADLVGLTPEDLAEPPELDAAVEAAVEQVRPLVENPPQGMRRFTWIRLLASLDFLRRYARQPLEADVRPPYIQNNFEQPAIEAAIERLRAFPG